MPLTSEAFGLTDVGKKRPHNEDALLVDPELGLYAVADGMGGHAAGEIASKRATEMLRQHILSNRSVLEALVDNPAQETKQAVVLLVESAIQRACSDIYRLASADPSKRGMGTTLVCLLVVGTKGVIGHVGDSRIYLLRAGKCHRLTEDHTLVAAQVKSGTLTKKQAASSQFRNVITRAVGIQESVQVDTLTLDLLPEDSFLLCSDGLHGYLEDEELEQLVNAHPSSELPQTLVALANQRGGRDNITALVVSIEWDGVLSDEEAVEAHARMEMMRTMPLFRHLTYKEQTAVLSIASTKSFELDDEILSEGDRGDDLFIVVKGRVMIEKSGVQIAEVQTGGHFGEMGLVDSAPRSATVRATEPTRAMVIPRSELMTLMKREPVLAVKMLWSFLQVISDRLRATNSDLSEVRQELALAHAVQPFAEE